MKQAEPGYALGLTAHPRLHGAIYMEYLLFSQVLFQRTVPPKLSKASESPGEIWKSSLLSPKPRDFDSKDPPVGWKNLHL